MIADQKIEKFFRIATKYMGKEIALPSNSFFEISYKNGEKDTFKIQYGFPQSGSVSMDFSIGDKIDVSNIKIFAQPPGKSMVTANYAPKGGLEEIGLGVSMQVGLGTGTVEYTEKEEINNNPNALQMLDIATSDLEKALVIGKYNGVAPDSSEYFPISGSSPYPTKHSGLN